MTLRSKRPRRRPRGRLLQRGAGEDGSRFSAELPLGRELSIDRDGDGALLSIREPSGKLELELEIVVGPAGSTVRVRASSLEIEARDTLLARCADFRVEATNRI